MTGPPPYALRFESVDLDRGTTPVLSGVDWSVARQDRWVILGTIG